MPDPAGRVLLVCPGGLESLGGIARIMGYLTEAWQAAPDTAPDVVVIDSRGPGRAIWSPLYTLAAAARIARQRLTGRVWLLHVNISDGLSVGRKAVLLAVARLLRLPVVLHCHGATFPRTYDRLPGFARAHVRRMFQRAAGVVVLGRTFRDYVTGTLGVAEAKVAVLDNAVPAPLRLAAPSPGGPCRLLFLGGLSARKGVPELLQALATPALAALDWRITLAGGGPVAEYRADAEALGLGGQAAFPGWLDRPATAALLQDADLLILPSHDEGMPIAILEALSYRVPVLATPVGAIPEFLEDEMSALLVPPGDVPALAGALARLIADPALRARLAEAGHRVFTERFAIEAYARRLQALYHRFCP